MIVSFNLDKESVKAFDKLVDQSRKDVFLIRMSKSELLSEILKSLTLDSIAKEVEIVREKKKKKIEPMIKKYGSSYLKRYL